MKCLKTPWYQAFWPRTTDRTVQMRTDEMCSHHKEIEHGVIEYRCFIRLKSLECPGVWLGMFDMHVNHHNGQKITSFLSAIYAAFDLLILRSGVQDYERKSDLRKKLVMMVKKWRYCTEVYQSGFDGMPDRLVLLPVGRMAFVELKAPGSTCVLCRKSEKDNCRR
jgi:hypothetical protein